MLHNQCPAWPKTYVKAGHLLLRLPTSQKGPLKTQRWLIFHPSDGQARHCGGGFCNTDTHSEITRFQLLSFLWHFTRMWLRLRDVRARIQRLTGAVRVLLLLLTFKTHRKWKTGSSSWNRCWGQTVWRCNFLQLPEHACCHQVLHKTRATSPFTLHSGGSNPPSCRSIMRLWCSNGEVQGRSTGREIQSDI